ncbi:MAG: hypothetical protein LW650_08480 [Planctomycetaceae bacterium]|nr:hypothetical protein [Phycisphaerales bacterium]MCE2653515.1 hypothetical protein [Planctomycetaceae bacterium]
MRTVKMLVGMMAVGCMALPLMAQPGGGGGGGGEGGKNGQPGGERPRRERAPGGPGGEGRPGGQMSPEKAKAAWGAQAAAVAARLGLNEGEGKALAEAYVAARESHGKAAEEARRGMMERNREGGGGGGGPGGGDREQMRERAQEGLRAMAELNKKEQEKFAKALEGKVAADKAASAVAVLGTFNRQYDVMTDALVGLKLEAGKQQQAMEVVERFVAAQEKARPAAGGEGDREGAREAMTAARNSMREEMAKVLSADEMKKFEETLPGARGRGQGGGEGGKGGGKGGEGGKGGGEGGGKGGGGR